jgi:phage-related protein
MKRQIVFYETEGGASPVEKFMKRMPIRMKEKLAVAFESLREDEHPPSSLFCKMVNTDDLWEIRVRHDTNICRVLCFFDGSRVVVVAHGFYKKAQKTPRQEIQTAQQRKREYFRREKR